MVFGWGSPEDHTEHMRRKQLLRTNFLSWNFSLEVGTYEPVVTVVSQAAVEGGRTSPFDSCSRDYGHCRTTWLTVLRQCHGVESNSLQGSG